MTFVQHMRWDVGIRYWNTLSKALHAVKWSLVQRMNCDGFLRWVRHLCVKSAVVEKVSLCFCMVRGALEMEARIICLRAAPTKCIRLLHGFISCLFLWVLHIVLALEWKKTYWENQHTNGWPFHGFASCLFLWTLHIVLTFEWKRTYCENQHTNRWPFQGFDIVCGSRSGICPWVGAKTGRLCCEEFGGDRHVRLQSNGGEVRHLLHLHQFQRAVIVAIVVTVIIWIDLWCPSSLRTCMHNKYFGCYHRCFLHQCVRV